MLSYCTFNLLTRVELSRFLTGAKLFTQKPDYLHTSAGEVFYALNHHTKENVEPNIALSLYFVLILLLSIAPPPQWIRRFWLILSVKIFTNWGIL